MRGGEPNQRPRRGAKAAARCSAETIAHPRNGQVAQTPQLRLRMSTFRHMLSLDATLTIARNGAISRSLLISQAVPLTCLHCLASNKQERPLLNSSCWKQDWNRRPRSRDEMLFRTGSFRMGAMGIAPYLIRTQLKHLLFAPRPFPSPFATFAGFCSTRSIVRREKKGICPV